MELMEELTDNQWENIDKMKKIICNLDSSMSMCVSLWHCHTNNSIYAECLKCWYRHTLPLFLKKYSIFVCIHSTHICQLVLYLHSYSRFRIWILLCTWIFFSHWSNHANHNLFSFCCSQFFSLNFCITSSIYETNACVITTFIRDFFLSFVHICFIPFLEFIRIVFCHCIHSFAYKNAKLIPNLEYPTEISFRYLNICKFLHWWDKFFFTFIQN